MAKFIKNTFIIFFILIIFTSKGFSQKSIIIFKTDYSNNYMNYAIYDLIIKNIFLYSNLKIMNSYSNYSSYNKIKSQIKKITINNNANISIAYQIQNFKNGILINYIIFDNEKPNEWIEKSAYSREEDLFISINKILKDIYEISKIKNKITYIKEKDYISLLGYYSQKIILTNNEDNIYKLFYDFHKDNIYFNIDYLEYLTDKSDRTSVDIINDLIKNMQNYINKKKNHYYLYSLGCMHYGKYKVNVILSDIEASIENYNKALKLKNNYYKYYYRLANAYILKNDYDNAIKYYEEAIKLNEYDINIIKEFVSLLKRDINKNGNEVISYLKKIIEINKNDEEALEEISKLYEKIGDYDNALIYYNKLFEVINYNLYIINNETKDADAYDRYILKRNSIKLNIESLNKKIF
ncbi:tetratricopeptide repeat protein [Brachyspira aalborgi]|uniref:Tetratricopeptide repeat protein n=1 Tax=Brachyspira aalborgi TaxID=29522 RepID=A0ABY3KBG5_9SPIR|nr:tetratricopeptide repeat protein [Brachyspira aalborgi]TXJ14954.1 tetratricopeptide repeat protein [Brachyspira aalborgi]TXJ18410.1 tetratricopeptide repeat protein [Brachyspira aalborgi]TXJ34011.1 tetratricopeptide repeat protein [Brachyspira aalborgi]TXJ43688.1 tetratricopeptide repeat protein [Brachyspira aalborgi]TXJ48344.1 tetratricopeptide repeat protein [Brachyspira aalborgi]